MPNPDWERVERLSKFLEPYRGWPVDEFGPDEFRKVPKTMVKYRYFRSKNDLQGESAEK